MQKSRKLFLIPSSSYLHVHLHPFHDLPWSGGVPQPKPGPDRLGEGVDAEDAAVHVEGKEALGLKGNHVGNV